MTEAVYLDWNATTPPHPEVLDAMLAASKGGWGNPASLHGAGRQAKALVERAREAIASLTGYSARDVVLTSGGTEANNLAVSRPFLGPSGEIRGGTCITSKLEHPSVVAVAESLAARGVNVVWLGTPASGRVDAAEVRAALEGAPAGVRLVAVQAVNHETGVLQPILEIAAACLAASGELHVDAVQAAGRLDVDAFRGADSIALASHKMRGPKGIGALAVRPGILVRTLLRGGGQERGLRPGTVDAVGAAGFGAAALRATRGPERYQRLGPMRDWLERELVALGTAFRITPLRNGTGPRAPHVTNLSWPGWAGAELAAALDLEGVCVSAGSACSAGTPEPSAVITAMVGAERARTALRISLGEETEQGDLMRAVEAFRRVLGRQSSRA